MLYQFPDDLWTPQKRACEAVVEAAMRLKHVCLYSPTGGGKTSCAAQLFKWLAHQGLGGTFYVNRRLLVQQTLETFKRHGLWCGVRAAEFPDLYNYDAPFQIASADTEKSRVLERGAWDIHPSTFVIVDEAHLQKTKHMRKLLEAHKENGAIVVLLTATPIGLSKWADEIVIPGKLQEYRDCGALVPVVTYSICQPDLSKVKRNVTGEYVLDGKKKKIYTQSIVGDVLDRWKTLNPDARPTMMYAPGVQESVWLCSKFQKIGVNFCHIDATEAVVDGIKAPLTRSLWQEIMERYLAGDIKGISSRYKAREGIDLPATYCCLLATPIGSLASFIQTVGRAMRSAKGKDHAIVVDFGGNYWRHGSPNDDRPWAEWWGLPERVVSSMRQKNIQDGLEKEPIRCPKCSAERKGGTKCPICGFEHPKSQRFVRMEDGTLREVDGALIKPRQTQLRSGTAQEWQSMYYGYKNSKKASQKTFEQMYGWFVYQNHYSPPRNLPFMPANPHDWCLRVGDVPVSRLCGFNPSTGRIE